mgnify:CR=1 FL=1
MVNGRRVTVPSQLVKPGDVIAVRERSRRTPLFREIAEKVKDRIVPDWLTLDLDNLSGRVQALPAREQIDTALNEQLIVEYYSR